MINRLPDLQDAQDLTVLFPVDSHASTHTMKAAGSSDRSAARVRGCMIIG